MERGDVSDFPRAETRDYGGSECGNFRCTARAVDTFDLLEALPSEHFLDFYPWVIELVKLGIGKKRLMDRIRRPETPGSVAAASAAAPHSIRRPSSLKKSTLRSGAPGSSANGGQRRSALAAAIRELVVPKSMA